MMTYFRSELAAPLLFIATLIPTPVVADWCLAKMSARSRPSARDSRSATTHGEATEVKLAGFTALTQEASGAAGLARNDTITA